MPYILNFRYNKRTLRKFSKILVFGEDVEHEVEMTVVFFMVFAVYQNIIKKTSRNFWRTSWKILFIAAWKVDDAFDNSKGITRNS